MMHFVAVRTSYEKCCGVVNQDGYGAYNNQLGATPEHMAACNRELRAARLS